MIVGTLLFELTLENYKNKTRSKRINNEDSYSPHSQKQ